MKRYIAMLQAPPQGRTPGSNAARESHQQQTPSGLSLATSPEQFAQHPKGGYGERLRRGIDPGRGFVYLAFGVLCLAFALLSPAFLTWGNLLGIGRQAAAVMIVAVAMTLVIVSGEIDLSVGSNVALSMMLGALAVSLGGLWAGVLVTLLTGAAIGFVNGWLTAMVGVPSFLVTLGMLGVARGVALQVTATRSVLINDPLYWRIFAEGNFGPVPTSIMWTALVVGVSYVILHQTRVGRAIYAVGGHSGAALRAGINVRRIKLATLTIVGAAAGLAALVLSARLHSARPNISEGLELDAIAAVILGGTSLFGGRGTIIGTVLGSLIIAVVNNGLILLGMPAALQLTVRGLIVIVAVSVLRRE
jgi:ribose transport system permease protein